MDNFIVSARKYRPVTFQTVVGQQHITGTLKNAIKNNQLAQAFLFCGPRGVGKTTCARILAKTINCENLGTDVEACGSCPSCVSFQNGNSFSIHELDAASNNSVDDIRSLIEQVRIPPQSGKFKIYIIDEVHMLSQAAFNAFLKTLEEPPSYAIFILATTEKHKIIPTILSRCQIFDFNRIKVDDISIHLEEIAKKENISFDQDGLHLIAQKSDGGLRDALSMFDQIVSFSERNVSYKAVIENLNILDYDYYFRITDSILGEDTAATLVLFDEILGHGFDGNHFISGLAAHFRNLLVCKDESTLKLLEVSEGIKQKYSSQSQIATASFLVSALNISNQCDLNYKLSKNQRLQVELALIKLCHIPSVLNLRNVTISDESAELKKKLKSSVEETPEPPGKVEAKTPEPVLPETAVPLAPVIQPETIPEKEEESPAKPVIKIPKPSMGTPKSIIPNLNDFESSSKEDTNKEKEYLSGESAEAFSFDRMLQLWNEYASKAKSESKINIFTIMTSSAPVLLENFKIEVTIENKIQEELLNSEKVDLLNHLRMELRNYQIDLVMRQAELSEKKKLYTSKEKYDHMLEKNPKLEEFRKRFNLDIDF